MFDPEDTTTCAARTVDRYVYCANTRSYTKLPRIPPSRSFHSRREVHVLSTYILTYN